MCSSDLLQFSFFLYLCLYTSSSAPRVYALELESISSSNKVLKRFVVGKMLRVPECSVVAIPKGEVLGNRLLLIVLFAFSHKLVWEFGKLWTPMSRNTGSFSFPNGGLDYIGFLVVHEVVHSLL